MVKAVAAQAKKKQAKAVKVEKRTIAEDEEDASLGIEFLFSVSKLSETGVDA